MKWIKGFRAYRPGPGILVAAAFIGPGTLTTCTIAGAGFGFALLWGLVFSILATLVLQEMAARLGIITQQGLGEALRKHFNTPLLRLLTIVLVVSAITIGNAAFETGNIMGATLGLSSFANDSVLWKNIFVLLIGLLTFLLLYFGTYKLIEKAMVVLVATMGFAFLTTAVIVGPPIVQILKGMFIPGIPTGAILPLIALIGTTVVPYNLFLYASAVQHRWQTKDRLPEARLDMFVSVVLGGLVSGAIVVTAAMAFMYDDGTPINAADLALQLQPLLGNWSEYFIAAGLFAAGISSAITAPLAAAWATAGIMGWKKDMQSWRFKAIWMFILCTGVVLSLTGIRPIEVILFAQAANGILLPVIAVYLLWVVNSKMVMGQHTNTILSNLLGGVVVLIALGLGLRSLFSVFGFI